MNHRIQCQCGSLHGYVTQAQHAIRGICYCKDCRAYSRYLGQQSETHDSFGGIEFVATQAKYVSFTGGTQNLACLSLSGKGLLRWYAKCCNTPICNTTRDWKFPYVGLIHTCLKADPASFERSFPRLQMRVNTGSARAKPPGMRLSTAAALMRLIPALMLSRANGSYRATPFFTNPSGTPVVDINVISEAERAKIRE